MALISCPECSKQVSSAAQQCPNCGYPLSQGAEQSTQEPTVLIPPSSTCTQTTETPAPPLRQPTRIVIHQPVKNHKVLARASWILIFLVCGVALIPFLGFASWLVAGPIFLVTFILSIMVIARGGTLAGMLLLITSIIVGPVFVTFAPFISSFLGLGAVAKVSIQNNERVQPDQEPANTSVDSQFGTAFFIQVQPAADPVTGERLSVTPQSIQEVAKTLHNRVKDMGTTGSVITPPEGDRIIVHIPGLTVEKLNDARTRLQQVSKLDFRMIHPETSSLVPAIEAKQRILDPAWTILPFKKDKDSNAAMRHLVVHRVPDITGEHIKSAVAKRDDDGWFVNIQFDKEAGDKYLALISKMRTSQDRFAIVLDNRIISAPTSEILGGGTDGHCKISGNFAEEEARALESALLNPLNNPVIIEEERFMDLDTLKQISSLSDLPPFGRPLADTKAQNEASRVEDYRSLNLDPASLELLKSGAPSSLDSEVKEELALLVGGWLRTIAMLGASGFGDSKTFRSRDSVLARPLMRLRKYPATPKAVIAAAERAQKTMQIAAVYASEQWPRHELAKSLGFSEIKKAGGLAEGLGYPDWIAVDPKELALRLGGSWLAVLEAAQIQLPKNDNLHDSLAAFAKVPQLPASLPYAADPELGARQFIALELSHYLAPYQDSWFGRFGSDIGGTLNFRQFTDRSVSVKSAPQNTPDAEWTGEVSVSFGRTRVYSLSGKTGSWSSWSQRPQQDTARFKIVRERGMYYVESVPDLKGDKPGCLSERNDTPSPKQIAEFLSTTAHAQIEVGLDVQVLVPAGRYYVGDPQEGAKAPLGAFEIDKYEVTIGEYRKFIAWCEKNEDREHEFDHPRGDRKMPHVNDDVGRFILNAAQGGRHVFKQDANPARGIPADPGVAIDLNSPMLGVTFWDAYAYAHWRGKIVDKDGVPRDLPTEEEWEAAARGTKGFKYPWGDELKLKNFNSNQGYQSMLPGSKTEDGYNYWAPVDAFGSDISEFKVVGMAGNVAEWVYRKEGTKEIPLLKGGSFASDPVAMWDRILKIPADDAWFVWPVKDKPKGNAPLPPGVSRFYVGDDVVPAFRSLYVGFRTVKRK